jgi:hypothetical protein
MKIFHLILKIIIAVGIVFVINLNTGCTDAEENTGPDTLIAPPGPPTLVAPEDGFVIMFEGTHIDSHYVLEWTSVEGAEIYEIDYQIDTFPPITIESETNVCMVFISNPTNRLGIHHWRVRANSSAWELPTDWSGQGYFELRYRPGGPILFYPADSEIVVVDSQYAQLGLQWYVLQDEEFYEFRVFKDTVIYDGNIVYTNSCQIFIDDSTWYNWQVRAGSSKWQYYSHWSDIWYFKTEY